MNIKINLQRKVFKRFLLCYKGEKTNEVIQIEYEQKGGQLK